MKHKKYELKDEKGTDEDLSIKNLIGDANAGVFGIPLREEKTSQEKRNYDLTKIHDEVGLY